ncbi:DUF5605 domain-containing protein [Streptomyces griseiscabiei]|uniref:DUF5605 domain-containing protein n=1 Tax=Streptomyces griseiscabiei TaxID=2993540 RepID=A0ABU4LDX0_9ACTN|nr:DUF5605 domain-containing protein [Streptomyces griseiscabiei]MBZ3900215.1 DUF5605 domain-containing protein [Streptomyces griseiscabiei]MDX2913223.1 DUF5605 domain-containing protein [Streptomyces griseiscabiei]
MTYGPDSVLGEILRDEQAGAVVRRHLPRLDDEPTLVQFRHGTLRQVLNFMPRLQSDPEARAALYADLATLPETVREPSALAAEADPVPSADYEPADVPVGSARCVREETATRWRTFELELHGPDHGNPFTDVALRAEFRHGDRSLTAHGFYDGEGTYRIRFLPDEEGTWTFRTTSNARSLDAITGSLHCGPARTGDHGPVRVHETFHFRHADGTRYQPVGTTAYAWTHQGEELEEQTLRTLAESPFNKIRMCVFPKSYTFNTNEPPLYPFEGTPESGWDLRRPNPAYFRHLEQRIAQLGRLGIQADLILFHSYDRWGFSEMSPAADARYVRYLVSRLAALPNVWWSLANEYDLVWSKDTEHWHRTAAVIRAHDPHGHLISVHECIDIWDNAADWVTHCSIQKPTENTAEWRSRWGKPVLVDELGYEGDIEHGWGNLTAEDMIRRCWEGVVRGGYVTHGECHLADDDVLWWAKGGVLKGESAARMGFLRRILEEVPSDAAGIAPLPSPWDFPVGGVKERQLLIYFGARQPRRRAFTFPPGVRYRADVIDTWNMTVTELPGTYEADFTLPLPGRPYIAVRLRAEEDRG